MFVKTLTPISLQDIPVNPPSAVIVKKEKKIPRYMQPNQAWLNKDKEAPPLIIDKDQNNHKSKASSFLPSLTQMLKKKKAAHDS